MEALPFATRRDRSLYDFLAKLYQLKSFTKLTHCRQITRILEFSILLRVKVFIETYSKIKLIKLTGPQCVKYFALQNKLQFIIFNRQKRNCRAKKKNLYLTTKRFVVGLLVDTCSHPQLKFQIRRGAAITTEFSFHRHYPQNTFHGVVIMEGEHRVGQRHGRTLPNSLLYSLLLSVQGAQSGVTSSSKEVAQGSTTFSLIFFPSLSLSLPLFFLILHTIDSSRVT